MPLSKTLLDRIVGKPYEGPPELTDRDGLSVRVSKRGTITFQYRYRYLNKARRFSIGRYPGVLLSEARQRIPDLRRAPEEGRDPAFSTDADVVLLDDILTDWLAIQVERKLKKSTRENYKSVCKTHLLGAFRQPVEHISNAQWLKLFDDISVNHSPVAAGSVLRVLKNALRWAIRRGMLSFHPFVFNLQVWDVGAPPMRGKRDLSWSELARIWRANESKRYTPANKAAIQVLILTAARQGEVANMDWSHISDDWIWTVPPELSKSGEPIKRPLSKLVQSIVEYMVRVYGNCGPVFPGLNDNKPTSQAAINKCIRSIKREVGFDDWRGHDFRRTLAKRLSEEGVAPHVIEKMLGHALPSIMATYNTHDWLKEQGEAYELYGRLMHTALDSYDQKRAE